MPIHPNVPQCTHIKVDGTRCGSPAKTGLRGCYFHNHIFRPHKEFAMPPLEDANAVQVAIMEIMLALVDDRMERPKAATLLYACQIAQSNLRNLSLAPAEKDQQENDDEMSLASILLRELRKTPDEDDDDDDENDTPKEKKPQQNAGTSNLQDHPLLHSVTTGPRSAG